jgi:hypothetical protein
VRKAFAGANEINLRQAAYDPVAAFQYVQFLTRYGDNKTAQEIVDQNPAEDSAVRAGALGEGKTLRSRR